jgi:hypothetical protein
MKQVRIKITATVIATVNLEEDETLAQFKERNVDIYLHGAGEEGHVTKVDLGGEATIEILES